MRNNILNFILFSLSLSVPESDVLAKIDVDELYSDVRRAQKATKRYLLGICDNTPLIIIICMYVFISGNQRIRVPFLMIMITSRALLEEQRGRGKMN